ncbi:hypothetical protein NC653_019388 [Populus alba x Populus x berolinensis]|uniref:Uncharacterized protein n=1 Tax=Populus alba x Populus x berolinensis TaxID=444605 RepID=A0AAD6QIV5_9ROSI|nr:hypothetical protein NC653_019388 [Populus alba x Populus x berolinensis]
MRNRIELSGQGHKFTAPSSRAPWHLQQLFPKILLAIVLDFSCTRNLSCIINWTWFGFCMYYFNCTWFGFCMYYFRGVPVLIIWKLRDLYQVAEQDMQVLQKRPCFQNRATVPDRMKLCFEG